MIADIILFEIRAERVGMMMDSGISEDVAESRALKEVERWKQANSMIADEVKARKESA